MQLSHSYARGVGLVVVALIVACRSAQPERPAPLFEGLGTWHHPVSTDSELAQRYFDQGLLLAYGFNHAEAARSFRAGAALDPDCPMFAWGEALVLGPNINKPMDPKDVPAAYNAAQRALALAAGAPAVERAYVEALAKRYAADPNADRAALDAAYADAMRALAEHSPEDPDAATLAAEALMDLSPWDYWLHDGAEPKPETREVLALLEGVLARHPDHPGANHYYIHAIEASDRPELAIGAAERLGELAPAAGHLVHMPAHAFIRVGRYAEAVEVNVRAAAADESYITSCRAQGFYPAIYYPHNVHFLYAAACMDGRGELAIESARKLVGLVPPEALAEMPAVEEFLSMPLFALARFGRWDEVLREPEPPAERPYSRGVRHWARGMALARGGDLGSARAELERLTALAGDERTDALLFFAGYTAAALLRIAQHDLAAEIAGASGERERQVEELERTVALQDALPYTEPEPWYVPQRQRLAAALHAAGRAADAERVWREDLAEHPDNGWSLYGLEASLRAQGRAREADEVRARFREAWQRADVEVARL